MAPQQVRKLAFFPAAQQEPKLLLIGQFIHVNSLAFTWILSIQLVRNLGCLKRDRTWSAPAHRSANIPLQECQRHKVFATGYASSLSLLFGILVGCLLTLEWNTPGSTLLLN